MPLKSLKNRPNLLNYHFNNAIFRKKNQCLSPDFDINRTSGNCSELRGAVSHDGELRGGEGEGVIIPIGPKGKQVS